MKILILGGAGFIGNALINYIKNNHIVYIVDNFSVNTEYKEIQNKKLNNFDNIFLIRSDVSEINKYKSILNEIEIIIYLASLNSAQESILFKDKYYLENVTKLNIFLQESEKYLKNIKKIILTSSRVIYGDSGVNPILEENKANPLTYYGITKYDQEKLMLKFCKDKKISLDIFRVFNVFGEEQHKYYANIGIIPMIYQQIIQNNRVILLNKGNIVRDFIYIEDVVKILFLSLTNIKQEINIYNLGSGVGISLLEICYLFKKLNYSFSLELNNNYYKDVVFSIANNQKIRTIYNYDDFFSVREYIIKNYKKA